MDLLARTKQALEANNLACQVFETKEKARQFVLDAIRPGQTIAVGGSMTVEKDLNLFPDLAQKGIFLNQYEPGLTPEQSLERRRNSFWADYYLTSSNAVTLDGELVNTDGTGNRIATIAIQYGPAKVFIIAGRNKIVKNRAEAFERIRHVAAPLNVQRLNKKTGCEQTGYCIDCKTPDRICSNTLITSWQKNKDRITVVLINEDLGY